MADIEPAVAQVPRKVAEEASSESFSQAIEKIGWTPREEELKEQYGVLDVPESRREQTEEEQRDLVAQSALDAAKAFKAKVGKNLGKKDVPTSKKLADLKEWIDRDLGKLYREVSSYTNQSNKNVPDERKQWMNDLLNDVNHDGNLVWSLLPAAYGEYTPDTIPYFSHIDDPAGEPLTSHTLIRFYEQVKEIELDSEFSLADIEVDDNGQETIGGVMGELFDFARMHMPVKAESKFRVNEGVASLTVQDENTNKRITLRVQQDLPILYGSPHKFFAAALNPYRNSEREIMNNGKGSYVEIDVFRAPSDWFGMEQHPEGNGVIIRIRDNAGGYPEEFLEKVTALDGRETQRAFIKGESTTGSGLGLAVTRAVIEKDFGGKVEARNWSRAVNGQEDKGAETLLAIPASKFVQSSRS